MIRGWSLVQQGQGEEGITQLRRGINTWQSIGAQLWRTHQLGLLAEAHGYLGQTDVGLYVLEEALETVRHTEEEYYQAELYRLLGELLLQLPDVNPTQAEACFLQGLQIARFQGAKSWEMRLVMSLGRLWQQQGRQSEAHELLEETLAWFTEGFDTPDLKEARALINKLSYKESSSW
jgi:predicted ATPase